MLPLRSKPCCINLNEKSIQELIADETKMMVFKSINDFGPTYIYKMFTRNSHLTERILRNTTTDLRLPLRKIKFGEEKLLIQGCQGVE